MAARALTSLAIVLVSLDGLQDTKKVPPPDRKELLAGQIQAEYQAILQRRLSLRIAQMQDFLKLEAKPTRQLSLAAKGAAKEVVEEYGEKLANYVRRKASAPSISINGRRVSLGTDVGTDEDIAPDGRAPALQIIFTIRFDSVFMTIREGMGSSGYSMNGGGVGSALEQKVWKQTLKKIATPEQLRAFAKYRAQQRREQAIRLLLSAMMLDLEIRDSQEERVRAWVNNQLETVSESDVQGESSRAISRLGKRLSSDGLDEILTKEQVTLFEATLADWSR